MASRAASRQAAWSYWTESGLQTAGASLSGPSSCVAASVLASRASDWKLASRRLQAAGTSSLHHCRRRSLLANSMSCRQVPISARHDPAGNTAAGRQRAAFCRRYVLKRSLSRRPLSATVSEPTPPLSRSASFSSSPSRLSRYGSGACPGICRTPSFALCRVNVVPLSSEANVPHTMACVAATAGRLTAVNRVNRVARQP